MKMPVEVQNSNWNVATENALKTLIDIQSMIDIMSERLVALRDLRLQEFIKQEIRSLEGKLVKHFWRQLSTKCKIPKDHWLAVFQSYPSLSQWLTVVGLSKEVNKKLTAQMCTVESLLELSTNEIPKLLFENGGDSEDERKLLAALVQLRGFDDKNGNSHIDTEGVYWDSWSKASRSSRQNGDASRESAKEDILPRSDVDYNENIRDVHEASSKSSRYADNHTPNPVSNRHEILVHTTSGRTTAPVWHERPNSNVGNQISPQSPTHSSRSSLSSSGPPSPPAYGTRLNTQTLSFLGSGLNSSNVAPSAPQTYYSSQEHPAASAVRSGQSSLSNTPPPMRSDLAYESGSENTSSKSAATGHNLLLPFGQMRSARSYEWQVGNHITVVEDENMTNSNLSLTSITTLPPPSALALTGQKLFSGGKKRKKRPGNIVIQGKNPPDLIDLLRPSNRRSSQTNTPSEGGFPTGASVSPMSPRTPMTPATPINSEMWQQHKDFSGYPSVPQTPKTPSRFKGLRAIKDKIKDKIGMRSKLRRNKSEERVADEAVVSHHHKVRSETFPLINASGIAQDHTQNSSSQNIPADGRHNSSHSSISSVSSSHFLRMHNESSSFDASLLSSGMTTPGEASMLSGRDNFGFDMNSYFENSSYRTGTDKTLVPEEPGSNVEYAAELLQSEQDTESLIDGPSDETDANEEQKMRANLMRQTSTTSSMVEEWDIPWDDLVLQEQIGQGRVGSVYRGKWHGEVAIRVINICHNDEFKLRAFKNEVMLYKMTRHNNVELFMGSCMNPPRLAIVTGFCRGKSLYHYIRANREQINLNSANIIAQHIAQGMGYLHSRGIIHKDLKSKNVFVDGKRVTVTDFGLMGLHAISTKSLLVKSQTLQIPDGWLCYMAPEVIRALQVPQAEIDVVSSLPYTKESDVFAFGTVWYELLTSCWPFKDYPAESIIWQVGNGKKQSLAHLQGAKESKDILMACWNFDPAQRPDFSDAGIMGQLYRLPQAPIIRRSSQPIRGNKRGGRPGALPGHDRLFDPPFTSVLHELAE